MRIEYSPLPIVKSCVIFLFAFSIVSGCTVIKGQNTKVTSIEPVTKQYKKLFQRKGDTGFQFNFVTSKNQLVIANMGNVDIFNLNTEALVTHWKIPEEYDWIKSVQVSKDQSKLYIFTQDLMQQMNTTDWQLLEELGSGKFSNEKAVFSEDEKLLFFGGRIWSNNSLEPIYEIGNGPSLGDAAFSPDNHYFVNTDHHSATPVIDIENQKWTGISYFKPRSQRGAFRVNFRDKVSFFIDYGAQIDLDRGGYFSRALGVFSAIEEDQLESFRPHEKITCWTYDPDYGVLVSLYDGDIYLLDDNLDIQFKWHMEDFARSCTLAKPGEIWLGGEKTGLYKVDLKNRRIMHEYQTEDPIYTLKVSGDGRYIGFVEQPSAESVITVLTPVSR